MADDYSSDISTKGSLSINGQRTAKFEASYDRDWFKLSLTAGVTYLFTLKDAAEGGDTFNATGTSLSLYNSTGGSVYGTAGQVKGVGPILQYTPSASGTYYLDAYAGYQPNGGTYVVTASLPAVDDFAAGTTTTGALSAGAEVRGVFETTNDNDWFLFRAQAGDVIDFSTLMGGAVAQSLYHVVYDGNGSHVATFSDAPFVANRSGDYYLSVGASGLIGEYTQTMTLLADDYSSDNSRPGTLYAGGQASGKYEFSGDSDRFNVALQEGYFYTVTLSYKSDTSSSLSLGLEFRDSAGGSYQSNGSYASGTYTMQVQAGKTDTYALNVYGNYYGAGTASYTVQVSAPVADDYGDTRAAATELTLGTTVTGVLQARSDIDMFKVVLSAGVTYRFEIPFDSGSGYFSGSLLDSSGVTVRSQYYSNDKSFTFTATKSGTFYLAQTGGYSTGTDGAYSVTVTEAEDDHGASAATAGRVTIGGAAKGVLEAGGGDVDWYAVSLSAGAYYWFTLEGASAGGTLSSYNNVLRLLDAQGNQVGKADYAYGGSASLLAFVAPSRGTYYVEVSSPGSAGSYTVKAQLGIVDDHGNDTAHASVMTAGATVSGRIELLTDRDVFKLSATAGMVYAVELLPGAGAPDNFITYAQLSISDGMGGYVATTTQYISGKVYQLFEAAQAGDYHVTVSNSSIRGTYTLTATPQGVDDYAANIRSTGVLAPEAPLHGNLGVPGDHDWVKVRLEAGRTYVFDLQGTRSGGGTLDTASGYGPSMTLMTDNGGYLGVYSNSGAGEPRISYIATKTGDYFLDVYHSGSGKNTGTYTLVETVTSGDGTAPKMLSSTLVSGAVVGLKPQISFTFSELVMPGSGISLTDSNGAAVVTPNGQSVALALANKLVIDPQIYLKPGMTYTLSLPEGSVLDLAGNKLAGAYSYSFTTAAPAAAATGGNDVLLSVGQGAMLDGGAGTDTVYYAGKRGYASITRNDDGSTSVYDYQTQSRDKLVNVERLLFSDGAYALDANGVAGQAYRLYQSAFDRSPDVDGLGFWIAALDRGVTLKSVASDFYHSEEFARLYGSAPTDAEFVTLLYKNVLHRAPDADGNAFWLNGLANGAAREQVLVDFSESAENVGALAGIIGGGFAYTLYG